MAAEILLRIILPALALVALGAVLQRRRRLDLDTLVKLNLYGFVPGFLLVRVAESRFAWSSIGLVGAGVLTPMLIVGLLTWPLLRRSGKTPEAQRSMAVGALFFNAGNFGIPVAQLAFGDAGGEVQALIVLYLNTLVFVAGYLLLDTRSGGWRGALRAYFRLPMAYVITAGFLLRGSGLITPEPPAWLAWVWSAARFMADGMVPVALVTLGAQMASTVTWPAWRTTSVVVSLKLLVLPAVTALVVWQMGLWPWPGAQLVLAAAGPTAVNTLLLTIEVKGDVDALAGAVFWTTALCAITVTGILLVLRVMGGGALPVP